MLHVPAWFRGQFPGNRLAKKVPVQTLPLDNELEDRSWPAVSTVIQVALETSLETEKVSQRGVKDHTENL